MDISTEGVDGIVAEVLIALWHLSFSYHQKRPFFIFLNRILPFFTLATFVCICRMVEIECAADD